MYAGFFSSSFFFFGVLIAVVICMFCINIFNQNFPKDHKKVGEKQDNLLYFLSGVLITRVMDF